MMVGIAVAPMGLIYGAIAALVFHRLTDARRIRVTVNLILAHIMEFRLFVDEPAIIWRAQGDALRANVRLLREIAIPSTVMAVLFLLIRSPLERRFGHGPLPAGEAAVMTSRIDKAPAVPGIVVETPGVRVADEVSWRIRATRDVSGGFPPGYEVNYPRSDSWLLWFIGSSTVGAFAASRSLHPRN